MKLIFVLLVAVSLVLSSIKSTQEILALIPPANQYASRWDTRDQKLRQAITNGETEAAAAGLPQYFGLHDLATEPTHWINICLAQYYGFQKVSGR